ncbi:MAG TPA: YqgE/AlgH family protein [Gemmataceae bacterium]|jgi:putative transcriptional regulator|nr:YqgE/AlgH family protein [Gemmataceae bacterium]
MSSLAGSFLVARTTLKDPFFRRSVILLLQHGADGAFGLVLNRPEQTKELPFPLHIGGPCKFQGLIMLHGQADWIAEEERGPAEICPGVYLGDAESLKRVPDPDPGTIWRFRVFTGYSGWGPGQLENELAEGSWVVTAANAVHVFDVPNEEVWFRLAPSTIPEPSAN